MSQTHATDEESLIELALRSASDTRVLVARPTARYEAAGMFASHFGSVPAVVVADENTFAAAGRDVCDSLVRTGHPLKRPFIFEPHVYADDHCARELQTVLAAEDAVPIAVGSGTINDLTKLAAHRLKRPYMVVATAASMDGYTAFGASITANGSKQTFDCPAPRAVLADLDVIAAAPRAMNAAGYADLAAKIAAGADWILADALGVEPIERSVWNTVQQLLPTWIAAPGGIAGNEPDCLRRLVNGLMMSGFAMQAARSSRPASGADHQFSHLWDMQNHTHHGAAPSHGFKVGIGTLASLALYEHLLRTDLANLNVEEAVQKWPSLESLEAQIAELLGTGELADKAKGESRAKYIPAQTLRGQLARLREVWPDLRAKLARQLIPCRQMQAMLRQAGCPCEPEQIGISRDRLRLSYQQALFIRRRFTVLDLAHRAGLLEASLQHLFGPGGFWSSAADIA
jgi:glycerol-1-phosphate dehydrogenase [NAD(P)+]